MTRSPTVAIVRSTNRRGAVAEALALIAESVRGTLPAEVVVAPDFTSAGCPWAWTHPDALSATLDAALAWGASRATVLVPDEARLGRSRLRAETLGRPVRFDRAADPTGADGWTEVQVDLGASLPATIRVDSRVWQHSPVVSIATMKTAGAATVALTLANALAFIHPADRAALDRDDRPIGESRAIRAVQGGAVRLRGRLRRCWRGLAIPTRPSDRRTAAFLREAEQTARLIAALAAIVRPVVSVVDGFVAMDREGPHHGGPVRLGVVIAGTDPVAVDAVAATAMGLDPQGVRHLELAAASGLGILRLDSIRLVGDPLDPNRPRCVPHSDRRSGSPADRPTSPRREAIVPGPHIRPVRAPAGREQVGP